MLCNLAENVTLRIEAACSSEITVNFYQITGRHIWQNDCQFHKLCRRNVISESSKNTFLTHYGQCTVLKRTQGIVYFFLLVLIWLLYRGRRHGLQTSTLLLTVAPADVCFEHTLYTGVLRIIALLRRPQFRGIGSLHLTTIMTHLRARPSSHLSVW